MGLCGARTRLACFLKHKPATQMKAAVSISIICETDAPSQCLLGPAENKATEKLSLTSGLRTWTCTHVSKDHGQDDAQDLTEHRQSPYPQRFSGDDSLHKTIPVRGEIQTTIPPHVTHKRHFPPQHLKTRQWSLIMTTLKIFYYTKCCYLTRLYLEISAL